jgi:hypothetical protein
MKTDTGHNLIYFRVYEPHKSGVPHMHAMLFLPNEYILKVKKRFYKYFSDFGTNKKAIDFKYTFYNKDDKGNLTGGAIAYIMKYITKTFSNEDSDTTDDAVYWYIKHKVRRFLSSRTLAPLILYRKIRHDFKNMENDYLYITKKYQIGQIQRLFNDTVFTINRFDPNTEEYDDIILYKKMILNPEAPTTEPQEKAFLKYFELKLNRTFGKEYTEMNYNRLMPNYYVNYIEDDLEESKEDILYHIISDKRYDMKYPAYKQTKNISKPMIVTVDGIDAYSFSNIQDKFIPIIKVPSKMKDLQLLSYFRELGNTPVDKLNLHHYGLVKNECISRGLVQGEIVSLNDYNTEFNYV